MSAYLPTVFGENLMDVFDDFDRNFFRGFGNVDRALYGKHAPVSYTHLDVYKRQAKVSTMRAHKVAMAAPLTPIRGAPRLPKIRMAFRLILVLSLIHI